MSSGHDLADLPLADRANNRSHSSLVRNRILWTVSPSISLPLLRGVSLSAPLATQDAGYQALSNTTLALQRNMNAVAPLPLPLVLVI